MEEPVNGLLGVLLLCQLKCKAKIDNYFLDQLDHFFLPYLREVLVLSINEALVVLAVALCLPGVQVTAITHSSGCFVKLEPVALMVRIFEAVDTYDTSGVHLAVLALVGSLSKLQELGTDPLVDLFAFVGFFNKIDEMGGFEDLFYLLEEYGHN